MGSSTGSTDASGSTSGSASTSGGSASAGSSSGSSDDKGGGEIAMLTFAALGLGTAAVRRYRR
jgi:hypothetical protein